MARSTHVGGLGALLVCAWAAVALDACETAPSTGVLLPPLKYRTPPLSAQLLTVASAAQVQTICEARGAPPPPPGARIQACWTGELGHVWPDPCEWLRFDPRNVLAALECHEDGHAMGWPRHHSPSP